LDGKSEEITGHTGKERMMEIKVRLSIGYPTASHEDIIEVPDDFTDEQIWDEVDDWANNYIDKGWKRI
jgi:hypothetical protein